jgi:hypothetical protein
MLSNALASVSVKLVKIARSHPRPAGLVPASAAAAADAAPDAGLFFLPVADMRFLVIQPVGPFVVGRLEFIFYKHKPCF